MCTGGESNQGPFGPKSDALSTAPLRPENWFVFLYVHDLEPRSRNYIDLQYSHTFMKSITRLYLATFRSQASIVSEKSTVFTVSYRKVLVSNLTLP